MSLEMDQWSAEKSQITPEDEVWWRRIVEFWPSGETPSDMYSVIQPRGMQTAGIGMYYLPHDMLGLQLASSVGPDGIVYCVDPQGEGGDNTSPREAPIGKGNASLLGRQIDALSSLGFALSPFEWLGPDSNIHHIPEPTRELDLIADHGVLEYVGLKKPQVYLRESVEEIVGSLRVGGLWVHHAATGYFLDACYDYPGKTDGTFFQWFASLHIRFIAFKLIEDSYRIHADAETLSRFVESDSLNSVAFGWSRQARLRYMVQEDGIIFPQDRIAYPKHWIFVAQKLAGLNEAKSQS